MNVGTDLEQLICERTKHIERRLDTLIGQVEQISELADSFFASPANGGPLQVYTAASGVGQANDTPASTVNGRIRSAFVTVGASMELQVYLMHPSLPATGVSLVHMWLNNNTPLASLSDLLRGQHVPQGAWFRVITQASATMSFTVYVDPLPATSVNVFRAQRP